MTQVFCNISIHTHTKDLIRTVRNVTGISYGRVVDLAVSEWYESKQKYFNLPNAKDIKKKADKDERV